MPNPIAITAESAGTALLKALLNEIRQLPKPWEQTPEREQEVVIDRLRRSVESVVRSSVQTIAAAEFPRLPATVESVTFKGGVKAVLKVAKSHESRHALADAEGGQALVVLASAQEFIEGMERIKADADQPDMFERDAAEQNQAPTDESWQALIDSLEQDPPEEGEEPAPPKSMGQQVHEFLAAVHVHVPLEVCESWTEQECTVAAYWAIEYAKDPENCAVARPHWLPIPELRAAAEGGQASPDAEDGGEGEVGEPDEGGDAPEGGVMIRDYNPGSVVSDQMREHWQKLCAMLVWKLARQACASRSVPSTSICWRLRREPHANPRR